VACACLAVGLCAHAAGIFEADAWTTPENRLDAAVAVTLKAQRATLRPPCSDAVFLRRAYVDLIGTLPTLDETNAFLADTRPDKRIALVDTLLARDAYADYWAMKWCDVLRVKSEFPMNLWPNAAQAYHRWVRAALHAGMPYDRFARELLTASGSNFRVPQVNFYRALPARDPATIAKGAALTFMGTRLEKWPAERAAELAVFFSRVAYKKSDEWKEEFVLCNPEPTGPIKAVLPDGTRVTIPADGDPREAFANWLITPQNTWFSRAVVNRLWCWTMGYGIVHEADDLRADNPIASPETLNVLADELVKSKYDLRAVLRLICTSRTYGQSALPHDDDRPALRFAHYTIRRLDAEVLLDALCYIGGSGVGYVSATPEPYTYIPKENRTVALADASITSAFLATFGRPARDTGLMSERDNRPTDFQRLYLLNAAEMQKRITGSPRLAKLILTARKDKTGLVRDLYALLLSRAPTPEEITVADQYFTNANQLKGPSANDLAWALINTKEFLYRH
jgi:hypothetical protein